MASDLPVDLLEEIFLRLDDAADLARASAACASFRRVVSDGRFLRRFRSLHRRPVLGLLLDDRRHCETGLFCPAQSSQAAAGFAKAADFTFSFLADRSRWRVCDARDGRVLLTRCPAHHYMFEDLVVYDPLHRRHVQIPTIPIDLLVSAKQDGNNEAMSFDDPFLAPASAPSADDDKDDDDEGAFRVMFTALSKTMVVALVFSSSSGQWRCAASFSNPSYVWANLPSLWSRQYVHSRFCWAHDAANAMLVLDTREMKFSLADLPRKSIGKFKMAVEVDAAGTRRLGLLLLNNCSRSATVDLYYSKAWQQGGSMQEPEEWQWQHHISVPVRGFHLILAGAAEGHVLLRGIPAKQHKLWTRAGIRKPEAHYFSMEIKTLLLEKLCVLEYDSRANFLYAGFPPPFSLPSV